MTTPKRIIQDPESQRASFSRQGAAWKAWSILRDTLLTQINSSDHNPAVKVQAAPEDSWELDTPQLRKYFVKGGPESHGQHGFVLSNANWDPYPMANESRGVHQCARQHGRGGRAKDLSLQQPVLHGRSHPRTCSPRNSSRRACSPTSMATIRRRSGRTSKPLRARVTPRAIRSATMSRNCRRKPCRRSRARADGAGRYHAASRGGFADRNVWLDIRRAQSPGRRFRCGLHGGVGCVPSSRSLAATAARAAGTARRGHRPMRS